MVTAIKNGIRTTFADGVWELMGESKNGWVKDGESDLPNVPLEVREFLGGRPLKIQTNLPQEALPLPEEVVAVQAGPAPEILTEQAGKYKKEKTEVINDLNEIGVNVSKRLRGGEPKETKKRTK